MPKFKLSNTKFIHYQLIEGDETMPYLIFLHEGLGCCEMWKDFPGRLCSQTGCTSFILVGHSDGVSISLIFASKKTVDLQASFQKQPMLWSKTKPAKELSKPIKLGK